MIFKRITDDRLKIQLTGTDMEKLQISYEQLDYSDGQTRKAILVLLELAREETGFDLGAAKLFVEAYPHDNEGCVIYFTMLDNEDDSGTKSKKTIYPSVVFMFDDADVLIDCTTRLFEQYCHRIYKSSLYYFKERFHLVVYPFDRSDDRTTAFISEYAKRVGEGELYTVMLKEHGELIVEDNAVDRLAYHLGQKSPAEVEREPRV